MESTTGRVASRIQPRRVEREWLDDLPVRDPRAVRARRDLERVNGWMGQARVMRRLLLHHWTGAPPRSILDLGGGDGTFLLRLARSLVKDWPELQVTLVDTRHVVTDRTHHSLAALGWRLEVVEADVFDALARNELESVDITIANLFLHHLDDRALAPLLRQVSTLTTLFVASEPRRSPLALIGSRMLGVIGCNDVTRHDARVSVRSGFLGRELSDLWPHGSRWGTEERRAGLFSHAFAAWSRRHTG